MFSGRSQVESVTTPTRAVRPADCCRTMSSTFVRSTAPSVAMRCDEPLRLVGVHVHANARAAAGDHERAPELDGRGHRRVAVEGVAAQQGLGAEAVRVVDARVRGRERRRCVVGAVAQRPVGPWPLPTHSEMPSRK